MRRVDRDLMVVDPQSVTLGVAIGKESALEHLVGRESDAGHDVGRVAVEFKTTHLYQRKVLLVTHLGPQYVGIPQVEICLAGIEQDTDIVVCYPE